MVRHIITKLETVKVPVSTLDDVSLYELVNLDPNFRLFKKALRLTGLIDLLSNNNMYTVFLPTDDAFYKLGEASMEYLFDKDNRDVLREVVLYHISPKIYTISNIYSTKYLDTLSGMRIYTTDLDMVLSNLVSSVSSSSAKPTELTNEMLNKLGGANKNNVRNIGHVVSTLVGFEDKKGVFGGKMKKSSKKKSPKKH
jgi:uncharacterized surface protein with fasciclin (FAS1) repeats